MRRASRSGNASAAIPEQPRRFRPSRRACGGEPTSACANKPSTPMSAPTKRSCLTSHGWWRGSTTAGTTIATVKGRLRVFRLEHGLTPNAALHIVCLRFDDPEETEVAPNDVEGDPHMADGS